MTATTTLDALEAERQRLLAQLAALGDLRPGSLASLYLTCGKAACHCARAGDPGHGPHWLLTSRVQGKTRTRAIPPAAHAATRARIAACQRLRQLVAELIAVSEDLCQARLQQRHRPAPPAPNAGEKSLVDRVRRCR